LFSWGWGRARAPDNLTRGPQDIRQKNRGWFGVAHTLTKRSQSTKTRGTSHARALDRVQTVTVHGAARRTGATRPFSRFQCTAIDPTTTHAATSAGLRGDRARSALRHLVAGRCADSHLASRRIPRIRHCLSRGHTHSASRRHWQPRTLTAWPRHAARGARIVRSAVVRAPSVRGELRANRQAEHARRSARTRDAACECSRSSIATPRGDDIMLRARRTPRITGACLACRARSRRSAS
jgi:hypothetical protein